LLFDGRYESPVSSYNRYSSFFLQNCKFRLHMDEIFGGIWVWKCHLKIFSWYCRNSKLKFPFLPSSAVSWVHILDSMSDKNGFVLCFVSLQITYEHLNTDNVFWFWFAFPSVGTSASSEICILHSCISEYWNPKDSNQDWVDFKKSWTHWQWDNAKIQI